MHTFYSARVTDAHPLAPRWSIVPFASSFSALLLVLTRRGGPQTERSDVSTRGHSAKTGRGDGTSATGLLRSLSSAGNLPTLVWLIPCGIAAVYLSLFVAKLPHNLWVLGWNSDFASGFTVPATVVETGTGGHTVLGTSGLYVPLWYGLLTARLPLHRELWEIGPTVLFIAAALTIGWSVAQIATRRAAILAVLIVLIASAVTLSLFMAAVVHNSTYPCTALLGAYLIWLTHRDGRRRATVFAVPLLAAVVLGTCLASDALIVSTGIVPFTLTAVLVCLRRDRRSKLVALSALTTVVVALPIAEFTSTIMSSLGYRTHAPALAVASLSLLPTHGQQLLNGLERLFNGYLGGPGSTGTLHAELGVACDSVMAMALLTLLVAGTRSVMALTLSRWRVDNPTTPTQLATTLHVTYWVSSALTACGAFTFSAFVGSDYEAFYATVIFSVAAVIPLFLSSRSRLRWLIPVGTSIFFIGSLVGLASPEGGNPAVFTPYEGLIVKIAQANHATAGYAGYWDASNLTWSSHERVTVRPVFRCSNPGGANLCIFPQETVPSWYVAKPRHTFLLARPEELNYPEGLGPPLAIYSLGPGLMFIYPYDIASRLGPPSD